MPDPTLNLSDDLNNWTDTATKVEGQNKALSDTNAANWVDSGSPVEGVRLTQGPALEILSSSTSNVTVTQNPVEIIAPTQGLIQLVLSDTMTLSDSIKIGRGLVIAETLTMTDSVTIKTFGPITLSLSDTLTLSDSAQERLAATIQLTLSDSMTTLTDSVTTLLAVPRVLMTQEPLELFSRSSGQVRFSQGPVEIIAPTAGLMELKLSDTITLTDVLVKNLVQGNTRTVSDTMSMSDSFSFGFVLSLNLSDSFTLTDSFQSRTLAQIQLMVSDQLVLSDSVQTGLSITQILSLSDTLSLSDSIVAQLNVIVFLTASFSDDMNFWADDFEEVTAFHPRDVPSGDPTDNCCPPNIFITD